MIRPRNLANVRVMATELELKNQITNLETILNAGASSHSEDGRSTAFDLKQTRSRLADLKNRLTKVQGKRKSRPRIVTVDMRGLE